MQTIHLFKPELQEPVSQLGQFLQVDTVSIAVTALSPIGIAVAVFIVVTALVVFNNRRKIKTLALKLGIFSFNMETHDDSSRPEDQSKPSDLPPTESPPEDAPKGF